MNKYEMLQNKLKNAIKTQDEVAKVVLRNVVDNIQKTAIAKKCKDNITDELVNEALLKEKKILQEQIETCPIDRLSTKEILNAQLVELNKYVPPLLDEPEEIREIVKQASAAAGIELLKSNKGAIMKTVIPILKGKADMKVVNQIVTEELK